MKNFLESPVRLLLFQPKLIMTIGYKHNIQINRLCYKYTIGYKKEYTIGYKQNIQTNRSAQ